MSGILQTLFLGAAAAVKDAYFNLVTLLLPGNGTNGAQNNTFLDSSTNNFTITRNGNTTQGTFTPFSQTGWGNYFNGTNDSLSAGTSVTNFLCTGSTSGITATFEAWVFPTSWNGVSGYMNNTIWAKGGTYATFGLYNGTPQFFVNGGGTITGTSAVSLNTWSYVAVTLSGANVAFYINGVAAGTGTLTGGIPSAGSGTPDYVAFQAGGPSNSWFAGYISNFRISNIVRYSGAFTPSTTPLTALSGTVLLTCQSNRFLDNSSNAYSITINGGTPSVQAFSPFAPTAAYSTSVVGGSGYFDGTGDYLSATGNSSTQMGTGAFTWECWCYITSVPSYQCFIDTRTNPSSGSSTGMGFILNTGTYTPIAATTGTILTSSINVQANAWNHVALTRTAGGTLTIWVNGVSGGTVSNSTNMTDTALFVGGNSSSGYPAYVNGYLSNTRITKGSDLYTATFTPPTAPLTTTVSGGTVGLLLNFTNAGIIDNAAKNDLETVGNAQISTTQSKWGGSSMYFNGTGSYLTSPNSNLFDFGSGNFTLEGWFYPTTSSPTSGLVAKRASSAVYAPFVIETSGSLAPTFYFSTTGTSWNQINSSVSFTVNTWNHFAATRNGSTFTIWINGSSGGTATNSSALMTNTDSVSVGASAANGDRVVTGYMDDVRFTKGYARYTANFTPPTAAFPLQ